MTTNLDLKQIILLKAVKKVDEPSQKELYEEYEDLQTHYKSYENLSHPLKKMEEELQLISSSKAGRKRIYELTDKGVSALHRENKESREDPLTYGERVRRFEEFIEKNEYMQEQLRLVESGREFAVLDYQILDKWDVDLGDKLVQEPKSTIEALQEAFNEFITRKATVDIRIENVYDIDTKPIGEIMSGDLNKLTMAEGVIKNVSKPKTVYDKAVFECQQCAERIEKDQDWNKLKSPYKCDCGSKRFEPVEKMMKTLRLVTVKSKPGQASSQAFPVYLIGSLAEQNADLVDEIGKPVRVIGHLRFTEQRGKDYLDFELHANNLVLEDKKWEEKELDEERVNEIEEVHEETEDVSERLAKSLGYEKFEGMILYRKANLIWLLGRTEDFGNAHILVVGDPGTAKTHIAKYIKDRYGRILFSTATGASGVGLTAAVRQDEITGEYVAEAGSLAMSDGGYHITDEMDKLDNKHYKHYNEALSDEIISIDKAGLSVKLPANTAELSIANPIERRFQPETENYKQIPIEDEDLRNRYSIILAVEANTSDRELEGDKFWKIVSRGMDEVHGDYDYIEEDLLFDYIYYASQINPTLEIEEAELLREKYLNLWESQDEGEGLVESRMINSLICISIAFARMDLSEKVTEKHINQALNFVGECYKSLDFTLGKDSFDDMAQNPKRKLTKVRSTVNQMLEETMEGKVEKQDVVEESDLPESAVEEVFEKLENEGEYYEPKPGYIAKL